MYDKFAKDHAYARRNGYSGNYDEYVANKYNMYRETCKRCGIKPASKQAWFSNAKG